MKMLILPLALVLLTSTVGFSQDEQPANSQKHAEHADRAETTPVNDKHKDHDVNAATAMIEKSMADDDDVLAESVRTAAQQLPADSHRRSRLLTAADQLASDATTTESSTAGRAELAEIVDDMKFQPIMEADQPAGFPRITPVGEIELKSYPAYRMVRTTTEGSSGFFTLFKHIQSNEIAMTAPVEMTYTAKGDAAKEQTMAFLYGDPTIGETGKSENAEVIDVKPLEVISMGMRGETTDVRVAEARSALVELASQLAPNRTLFKDTRVLGYNSPGVSNSKRYFEVQIQLEPPADSAN